MPTASQRFWVKVDKNGPLHPLLNTRCWLWMGCCTDGYGMFFADGKNLKAARYIYQVEFGPIAARMLIDHRCRNRRCVNPDHLRLATHKQNAENQPVRKDSQTGVRNVRWNKYSRSYVVKITHNGRTRQYGSYQSLEEAAAAARAKRAELFTHSDD